MMDTKILSNLGEITMLKKWISNGNVELKLLWRGTRDGFSAAKFHSLCDNVSCHLTLAVDSDKNKIFGGFIDGPKWNGASEYRECSKAFLFSINEKETYAVTSTAHAIYAASDRCPTYGGGHNLYFCDGCNNSNSSYSNWSSSYYETKGKSNAEITGGYNFKVREIEVFSVTYNGDIACLKKWVN